MCSVAGGGDVKMCRDLGLDDTSKPPSAQVTVTPEHCIRTHGPHTLFRACGTKLAVSEWQPPSECSLTVIARRQKMLEMFALPSTGPALYKQRIIDGGDTARLFTQGMSELSDVSDLLLAASLEVEAAMSQEMPLGGASDIGRPPQLSAAPDGLLKDVAVNYGSCGLHLPPEMDSVDYTGTTRERQQVVAELNAVRDSVCDMFQERVQNVSGSAQVTLSGWGRQS